MISGGTKPNCRRGQDGMGWDGMGWDGMAWDGIRWHGKRWEGDGCQTGLEGMDGWMKWRQTGGGKGGGRRQTTILTRTYLEMHDADNYGLHHRACEPGAALHRVVRFHCHDLGSDRPGEYPQKKTGWRDTMEHEGIHQCTHKCTCTLHIAHRGLSTDAVGARMARSQQMTRWHHWPRHTLPQRSSRVPCGFGHAEAWLLLWYLHVTPIPLGGNAQEDIRLRGQRHDARRKKKALRIEN
jgi:hypothetical protein